MHLFRDDEVVACCSDNNQINELLFRASQMYEASREDGENNKMIDNLFLQMLLVVAECSLITESTNARFATPKSSSIIEMV